MPTLRNFSFTVAMEIRTIETIKIRDRLSTGNPVGESDNVNDRVTRTTLPWQLCGTLISAFLGVVVLTNRSPRNGTRVVARGQFSWTNNEHPATYVSFILRDIWCSDVRNLWFSKATKRIRAHNTRIRTHRFVRVRGKIDVRNHGRLDRNDRSTK